MVYGLVDQPGSNGMGHNARDEVLPGSLRLPLHLWVELGDDTNEEVEQNQPDYTPQGERQPHSNDLKRLGSRKGHV